MVIQFNLSNYFFIRLYAKNYSGVAISMFFLKQEVIPLKIKHNNINYKTETLLKGVLIICLVINHQVIICQNVLIEDQLDQQTGLRFKINNHRQCKSLKRQNTLKDLRCINIRSNLIKQQLKEKINKMSKIHYLNYSLKKVNLQISKANWVAS